MTRSEKNKKLLIGLICLTLVIASVIAAVLLWPQRSESGADIKLLNIESDKINEISVNNGGKTLTFTKESGQWVCREHPDFPLDGGHVDELAKSVAGLTAKRRLTAAESQGLNIGEPAVTVAVGFDGGQSSISFCGLNSQTMSYYTTVGGGSVVYMVANTQVDSFKFDLFSLADLDNDTPVLSSDLIELSITVPNAERLTLYFNKDGNAAIDYTGKHKWFYRRGAGDLKPASSQAATAVLDAFQNINNERLAAFNATDGEMQSFGLTDRGCTVVNMVYRDSAGNKATKTMTYAPATSGDMTVAARAGSRNLYFVDISAVGSLRAAAAADLDPHETYDVPLEAITGFTVQIGGSAAHYTLSYNEPEQAYYMTRDGGSKQKADSFVALYNGLVATVPQKVLERGTPVGEQVASITAETRNTFFKTVVFTIYRFDDSFYASTIADGAPLLLNKRTVEPLLEHFRTLVK